MSQSKDSAYTLEEIFHYKDKSDEVKKIDITEVRRLTTIKFDNTTLKSDIAILKENIKRYEKFVEELCTSQANTSSDHRHQGDWPPRIDPLNHVLRIPPSVNFNNTTARSTASWKDYGSCLDYFHSLTRQLRHIQSAFTGCRPNISGDDPRLARRGAAILSPPPTANPESSRRSNGSNNRQDSLLREQLLGHALGVPLAASLTTKEFEELMNQKNRLMTEKEDLRDKLKKVKLKFEKERIKLSQQQQQQQENSSSSSPGLIQMSVLSDFHPHSSEEDLDEDEEEEEWSQLREEEKWEDASSSVEDI